MNMVRVIKYSVLAIKELFYYLRHPSRYLGIDPMLGNDDIGDSNGKEYTKKDVATLMRDSHLG